MMLGGVLNQLSVAYLLPLISTDDVAVLVPFCGWDWAAGGGLGAVVQIERGSSQPLGTNHITTAHDTTQGAGCD
jgi:hypothetical protein